MVLEKEYGFEEIKDAFDEGAVPNCLVFSLVVATKILLRRVTFCHQTMATGNILLFLCLIMDKI